MIIIDNVRGIDVVEPAGLDQADVHEIVVPFYKLNFEHDNYSYIGNTGVYLSGTSSLECCVLRLEELKDAIVL